MSEAPTNPNACLEDATPCDSHVQSCPFQRAESQELKSIHIDIGWAFSGGAPTGQYELVLNGQRFAGPLNAGAIRVDRQLNSIAGGGQLRIAVTNGPEYWADVELGMPQIHSPQGLTQRLTNLGFYAGVRGERNGRALWAVRAFKRVVMNRFTRNQTEPENDEVSPAFMEALQRAYGAHPNDTINVSVAFGAAAGASGPCGMFGTRSYKRSSFETAGSRDDVDPRGAGNAGVWAGRDARVAEPIAGIFPIYLRAFDLAAGDSPIPNRVNVPQPIRMAQFVLFELGYWVVRGRGGWVRLDGTETRNSFTPDGGFGRNTQWAVREFQCHATMSHAAIENVNSNELRYLPRLRSVGVALVRDAQYPASECVSGELNQLTRNALQAWADQALRCPVIVYASTDNASATADGSDLSRLTQENIWLHDDHADTADRVYVIDYSQYYPLPAAYGGRASSGGHYFPRPIVVGEYTQPAGFEGGPVSLPPRHTWDSADTEVRPDTMIGRGGLDGVGLTAAELSTFKVIRTAAHFECLGYLDVLNAYDDVTISFGPCHWTLARSSGGLADEDREMPAFLAYFRGTYAAAYQTFFGAFGITPQDAWPLNMAAQSGTYSTSMLIETESGTQRLSGAANALDENKYCKTWHVYYRFQMACRTSRDMRLAMWGFTRIRVRDILNKTFTIAGVVRRVGDYVTSEKGAAMLLRWHIYRPAHLFRTHTLNSPNHLQTILTSVIAAHPAATQAREDAMLTQLSTVGGPLTNGHLTTIHGWTDVPQQGLAGYAHYTLNLTDADLRSTLNSFQLA